LIGTLHHSRLGLTKKTLDNYARFAGS
jgi:hypothetical protein